MLVVQAACRWPNRCGCHSSPDYGGCSSWVQLPVPEISYAAPVHDIGTLDAVAQRVHATQWADGGPAAAGRISLDRASWVSGVGGRSQRLTGYRRLSGAQIAGVARMRAAGHQYPDPRTRPEPMGHGIEFDTHHPGFGSA